jgi:nicotinamidase-related amidase
MASFRSIVGLSPAKPSISSSALIIVDAQNEYTSGKLSITNVDASRKAIAELLAAYRTQGGKIVHVLHMVPEGAPVFTPGTNLAQEFSELREMDGEAKVVKHHPNAFAGTDLEKMLKGWGVKTVVICGYMVSLVWIVLGREDSC